MSELVAWGWLFISLYVALMLWFGVVGMRRVRSSDDFATARGAYGPLFLALAMTATAASGATFLGLPGLAYQSGYSALGYALLYPVGVYLGVLLCVRVVRRGGARFGSRSMPEFLGERYASDALRLLAAVFSVLLLIYLAGQILAGAVMFTEMLGLELLPALFVSAAILAIYVTMGGAHADILTDGVQGALMLLLACGVLALFLSGFGVDGGLGGVHARLVELDPNLVLAFNPNVSLFNSTWDLVAMFCAHLPLGLLPHIGNKLWALRDDRQQRRFIALSFAFGLLLPLITLGGLLARAVLGDALLLPGASPNNAVPALFAAILPAWSAALIGAGVLAAVMSTADGLVISTAQIFANDIFRCTLVPKFAPDMAASRVDRISLLIGRIATLAILVVAVWIAWQTRERNVALLVWVGLGGMMAATAAPMFLGVLWRRATAEGAICAFLTGAIVFAVLHAGWVSPPLQVVDLADTVIAFLAGQASNPYACATLGGGAAFVVMVLVSLVTEPPPGKVMEAMFP